MSSMSCRGCRGRNWPVGWAFAGTSALLGGTLLASATAEVRVAPDLRVEMVTTGIPRPLQLAFNASGGLVVLSHGWRGDAAAEIYYLELTGPLPVDAARVPRVVLPFAEESRKIAFGSLAIHPHTGDLFLGEENGNRIYRLTADKRLTPFAVGLQHLVGGSGLAFDRRGRLVVLDFASAEGRLRSEAPAPPSLDWLTTEDYHGPLVFQLDPGEDVPLPRRLDLVVPLFPRGWSKGVARSFPPRFVSVATSTADELLLLGSLGEVFRLTADGRLLLLARLPAGHYHRTHMAVAPDGSVLVSSGFHIRDLLRVSPGGVVMAVARGLGDPGGVAVDRAGAIYLAETALHRIIRIGPSP